MKFALAQFSLSFILIFNIALAEDQQKNWNNTIEMEPDLFGVSSTNSYTTADHGKVVACFFNSWAYDEKENEGRYDIDSEVFDGKLCTHLVYKFALINDTNFTLQYNEHVDITLGLYRKVINLKNKFGHLKILLGVGGSKESQRRNFNLVIKTANMNLFIRHSLEFVKYHKFDGLHLNWQFPNNADKDGFTRLAKGLKDVCQKNNLLLTTTMGGFQSTIHNSYNVFQVTRIFDLVFLQSYGYGLCTDHTCHQSPLHSNQQYYNTFDILEYILLHEKANPDKLVLGVPFYGEVYSSKETFGSLGLSEKADKKGKWDYSKICRKLSGNETGNWSVFWDARAKASFARSDHQWLTFNSPRSIYEKVALVSKWGLGGIMVSSIDRDDFLGYCSSGKQRNPLLQAVNNALTVTRNESILLCEGLLRREVLYELFTTNSTELIISDGSSISLYCLAEGNPSPNVTWNTFKYNARSRVPVPPNAYSATTQNLYFSNDIQLDCNPYQRILSVLTIRYFDRNNVGNYCCVAANEGFRSDEKMFSLTMLKEEIGDKESNPWVWLAGTLMVALCLLAVFLLYKKFKPKVILDGYEIKKFLKGGALNINSELNVNDIENPDMLPYNSTYEIFKGYYCIEVENILGSGAFGIVYKGKVRDKNAAVKSVKNKGDRQAILSLLSELKIMIYLENHPNIVNLLGAHTTELKTGVVYVFVEFCEHGNLLDYLRRNRGSFASLLTNDNYERMPRLTESTQDPMTEENLIRWSIQIACGLEYLRIKRVIHGDLAARNVLVFSKDCVKLTDFGLSRKLHVYSNYKYQKSNYEEPLPWRWMALESLCQLEFSYESDIWSYGVTLWEIFSLGEVPYGGMTWTNDFTDMIKNGQRIYKPSYATTKVYNLMLQCWDPDQISRPKPMNLQEYLEGVSKSFQ